MDNLLTIEELKHVVAAESLLLRKKNVSPADRAQAKIIIAKIDDACRANGVWLPGKLVLG